jgi:hypothetical protein
MSRRHHGQRPVPTTKLSVRVEQLSGSGRGVQVRLVSDRRGDLFWLPLGYPAEWLSAPEIGAVLAVTVPRWLAERHRPIRDLRCGFQSSLSFTQPPGIDPVKGKEVLPMAYDQNNRPPQGRGALFVNRQKQQPNHPDRRGDLTLPAGYVLTLANGTTLTLPADAKLEVVGWLKDTKAGEKYLSISAKPFQERQQQPPRERYDQRQEREETNRYAEATGRAQPQGGGPTFPSPSCPAGDCHGDTQRHVSRLASARTTGAGRPRPIRASLR